MVGLALHLLTHRGGGLERNPAAARHLEMLGNVTFLERPFHPTTLISLARSALRARRRQYEARSGLTHCARARTATGPCSRRWTRAFALSSSSTTARGLDRLGSRAGEPGLRATNGQFPTRLADAYGSWRPRRRKAGWRSTVVSLLTGEAIRFERELVATRAIWSSPPSGSSRRAGGRSRSCSRTSPNADASSWHCAN